MKNSPSVANGTTIPKPAKSAWQKTPYPNLIRYVPSGSYFGRVKVAGKLIRRSLETHVLEVAKLRLSDFLKDYRRFSTNKVGAVKGEVIIEQYRNEVKGDHRNKPATKLYKEETSDCVAQDLAGLV